MPGSKGKKAMTPRPKASTIRKEVLAVLKSVAEKKVSILSSTNNNTSATGTIWALSQAIIQGDSVFTRDGIQIMLLNTHIKLDIFMPTASVAASVRIIVFTDKQNNGGIPTILDVLNTAELLSPYSVIQQLTNRFRIHGDYVKNFTAGGVQQVIFDIRKQINHPVYYNAAGDTASANGKNALFMLIITDVGTGFPTYNFSVSNRFHDI